MRQGWYDASLERVDEGGIDGDDELTCNLLQQMLPNIYQHLEKMVVLKLFLENVFGADGVEHNMNDDAGHFGDVADNKLPWFQDCVVVYIGGSKHL